MLFVRHAVDRLAVPEDDIAAAERGDRILKPALARDAHREGSVRREHGVVRRSGKTVRHDEHGGICGNLAVLLRRAHRGDGGAHLAAEREVALELEDIFGCGKALLRGGFAVVAGEQVDAVDAGVFVDMADRERRRIGLERDGLAHLAEHRAAVCVKADGIAPVRGGQQPSVRRQHAHRHAGVEAEEVGVYRGGERFARNGCRLRQARELFAAVEVFAEVDGGDVRAVCRRRGDGKRRLHRRAGGAVLVAGERCRRAERGFREVCDTAEGAERIRVDRRRRLGCRFGGRFGGRRSGCSGFGSCVGSRSRFGGGGEQQGKG